MNDVSVIYEILLANTSVNNLVESRIYPYIAKEFEKVPFIVYSKVSVNPADSKDGPSKLDTIHAQVSIFQDDYDLVSDLAKKVRTALDRYTGNVNGIEVDSIRFIDETELPDFDTQYFHIAQEYNIRIKRL